MKRMDLLIGALAAACISMTAHAETVHKVAAKLVCGPHTANPQKLRAFQANMTFSLSDNQLTATRSSSSNGGSQEDYVGTIGPTGAILVTGKGMNQQGGTWTSEFRGQRNDLKDTELKGRLVSTSGAVGHRDCSIIFRKPRYL